MIVSELDKGSRIERSPTEGIPMTLQVSHLLIWGGRWILREMPDCPDFLEENKELVEDWQSEANKMIKLGKEGRKNV